MPASKRILEVNGGHPLLTKLEDIYKANADDARINDYAELLFGQALVAEGRPVKNPSRFTKLVSQLMLNGI